MSSDMFSGLGTMLLVLTILAIIGVISIILGASVSVIWLAHHVKII